jgi:hypothetical protein
MALPAFGAVGGTAAGVSTVQPAWPTHATDDIGLLFVQSANQVISLSDAQGFVQVPDSPQGTGTADTAGSTRLAVYWCRATSGAMAAPTVADSGDHVVGTIVTFRGCIATGNPWDVTAGDTGASNTAVSIPGDTTTVADCLIVMACAHGIDSAAVQFTDWANADLANLAERRDISTASGHGGGIGVATGEKATAGAYGVTTATLASASLQARMSIALKPPLGGATGKSTLVGSSLITSNLLRRLV